MGQPITDYAAFFASAGQAVQELEALNTEVEQLEADEKKLESSLKGKQRSVTETISQTVKQRKEEITKSYDAELGKAQDRHKKRQEILKCPRKVKCVVIISPAEARNMIGLK